MPTVSIAASFEQVCHSFVFASSIRFVRLSFETIAIAKLSFAVVLTLHEATSTVFLNIWMGRISGLNAIE